MSKPDRHSFHGDPARFPVMADFIEAHFGRDVRYIADVAGGQGMLTRLLNRRNYDATVIDPRGWRLRAVPGVEEQFDPASAGYYDLVVGLHPDQATQALALSALVTKSIIVPCCNFWDRSRSLSTFSLVEALEDFFSLHGVTYSRVNLQLNTPKNIALVTKPPAKPIDLSEVKLPTLERASEASRWTKIKTRKNRRTSHPI